MHEDAFPQDAFCDRFLLVVLSVRVVRELCLRSVQRSDHCDDLRSRLFRSFLGSWQERLEIATDQKTVGNQRSGEEEVLRHSVLFLFFPELQRMEVRDKDAGKRSDYGSGQNIREKMGPAHVWG